MNQPFRDLDEEYRPEARPVTALGRLLIGGFARSGLGTPSSGRIVTSPIQRYWCNRPGQHEGENMVIALAVTLAVIGLATGWLLEAIAPRSALDWLLTGLAIVPAFFLVLHLLIFAASGIEALARLLGVAPDQPPGHFPGRLFLFLLTATASSQFFRGSAGWLTLLVAGAWCLLAALDFLSLLLLLFRDLRIALANH